MPKTKKYRHYNGGASWLDSLKNTFNSVSNKAKESMASFGSSSTPQVPINPQPMPMNPQPMPMPNASYPVQGGRRRMKRGGGPAPVHNLYVAKPTYWIKGGRKSRKSRKTRTRKTRTRKTRSRKTRKTRTSKSKSRK